MNCEEAIYEKRYIGREDTSVKKDLCLELIWELSHVPKEERFEKAYQYCWSIQQGIFNLEPGFVTGTLKEKIVVPDGTKTSSSLYFEEGITYMRVNDDVHSFFLLPEPEGGIRSKLLEAEEYETFFKILGKPGRMKALLFLYSRKFRALSAKRMAEHIHVTEEDAIEILKDLCELKLLYEFERFLQLWQIERQHCYCWIEYFRQQNRKRIWIGEGI